MPRTPPFRWFVAWIGALVWLLVASPGRAAAAQTSSAILEYAGAFTYRFGDSPRGADDKLLWAQKDEVPGFSPIAELGSLPGRDGQRFLWLRTRLTGHVDAPDPVLHLRGVDQILEAYLDGELVYRFGSFEGPNALRFEGYRPHDIPLGPGFEGKTLALRVHSDHVNIGPYGRPLLGSRAAIAVAQIRNDLPVLAMGIVLCAIGLLVLALYASERRNRSLLAYGSFAASLGVYLPGSAPIRLLLADAPLAWLHVELASLYLMPIGFIAYFERVFGPGRARLLRALFALHGAFFVAATLLVAAGLVPLLRTLLPFQVLLLASIAVMFVRAALAVPRGSLDVRIFAVGFFAAAGAAVFDILKEVGLVSRSSVSLAHAGMFVLTLAMGGILVRHFASVQARVGRYSRVIELSLASTQVLERGQRARVALDEVLRLFGATRAMLFLVTPKAAPDELPSLDLIAAREAKGVDSPSPSYETNLVAEARARRKPVLENRLSERRASAMAAPLIVRDELLGVLYLEQEGARAFADADLSILKALAEKLSIVIVTTRAARLEMETAMQKKQLASQEILLDAVRRMAAGDIETPIVAEGPSEVSDLASALDVMRRDVQAKIHMLEAKKAEVEVLNEELRRKIQQRTTTLLSSLREGEPDDDDLVAGGVASFEAGAILAERYRMVRELGQGAMGVVYEVERIRDGRRFAAKLLTARSDKLAMTRFAREAQILAHLDHPNLASIVDVDVTPEGFPYLVMELCAGRPLSRWKERARDVPWALDAIRQIAEGLAAVHAQGVIHRDLKPGNVIVDEDPHGKPKVKVVDFGISTLTGDVPDERPPASTRAGYDPDKPPPSTRRIPSPPREDVTRTGILVGTPTYMAPELSRGSRHWKAHSDVFSLGLIAYEVLTGKRPFNVPPIFLDMQGQSLARPLGLRKVPGLSPAIVELFEMCLSKEPASRPTAQEIADLLAATPPA
jgi:predicted Ser/Thr protein kinase